MTHPINLLKEKVAVYRGGFDSYFARWYPRLPIVNRDLSSKRAIVTGANSGLGFEISKRLAEQGAEVWLFCRSEEKGRKAAEELKALTRNDRIFYDSVDFAKLREVREVVERWAQKPDRERIRQADSASSGLTVTVKRTSIDGFELTYVVNMLSQFLLTVSLLNHSFFARDARIVQISSEGQYAGGPCDPDDPNSTDMLGKLKEGQSFAGNWIVPYGRSKGQQTVFTRMLQEKLAKSTMYKDVVVSACHPGMILTPIWGQETTKAGIAQSGLEYEKLMQFVHKIALGPEEGAKTPLYLALAEEPAKSHLRGKYWDRCRVKWAPAWMEDEGLRNRLWARWEEDANVEAPGF